MGYSKYTWVDRAVQYAKRYAFTLITGSTYDIDAAPGTITQAGSAQTAARMNNIETGIEAAHKGTHIYAASATGNDTYVVAFTTPFAAYNTGMIVNFQPDAGNTGAATINVDALGAKTLKKMTAAGKADVATGDIIANGIYTVKYDGTDFIVDNPTNPALNPLGASGTVPVSSGTTLSYDFAPISEYIPSNTVLLTANTERTDTTGGYVTKKSFIVNKSGKVRIKGEYKAESGYAAYLQAFNSAGVAISGEIFISSTAYTAFSIDTTSMVFGGDTINLKLKCNGVGHTAYVRNVTLCADAQVLPNAVSLD